MARPRTFTGGARLALLLVVVACSGPSTPSPPSFRNLLLVMVDTLRADHLASYGYERQTAPFLDRLAEEGIQLPAYASSSWTKPSVATLLTGLPPQSHQAISRSDRLPEALPYLPELLAEAGFDTACYIGNLNVGRKWGFGRGFARYRQTRPVGKADDDEVNAGAFELLSELEPPFFLYLHYVDPHDPYRPEEPWGEAPATHVQPRPLLRAGITPTAAQLRQMVDQYDGEIRELDRALERLFAELERHGLLAETLVVVTSDHGEELGEHGGLTHGHSLYEELLEVPMLLWSPAGLPTYRASLPFFQLDFLPTVLAALNLPAPDSVTGRSQWNRLHSRREPERRPFHFHLDLDRRGGLAIVDPPLKLIHRRQPPSNLLFDLDADPLEKRPLPDDHPRLGPLLDQLIDHHNRLGRRAAGRQIGTVDDELRRGLAALGYLDLGTPEEELRERIVPDRLPRSGFEGLSPRLAEP